MIEYDQVVQITEIFSLDNVRRVNNMLFSYELFDYNVVRVVLNGRLVFVITDAGVTVIVLSEYYHNIFPYTSLRMGSQQNYTMYRTGNAPEKEKTDRTQFIIKPSVRFDQ